MRSSLRKTIVWQVLGLLAYFLGIVLFLSAAMDLFFREPGRSLGSATSGHVFVFTLSVVFIVGGRVISWKLGGEREMSPLSGSMNPFGQQRPKQTKLEELGYVMPPDSSEADESDFAYEDGTVYVVCPECGEKNDAGFRFCHNCSAQLPD